jgi:hypothetical protein
MKQLDRLLFEQGGDCFFCKQPLAKADASVEHLVAQANGGTSAEENVVACCKAINALLGSKPLKDKFAIILRQRQGFQCPAKAAAASRVQSRVAAAPLLSPSRAKPAAQIPPPKLVVSGTKRTKPPAAISSMGILALTKPSASNEVTSSAVVPCPTCRRAVPSATGQLDYVCQHCHGAFRY